MSGRLARSGFRYQDCYLLSRVLESLRDEFGQAWTSVTGEPFDIRADPARFGIEANTQHQPELQQLQPQQDLLDWDVFVRIGETTELVEVKSGTVRKSD